MILLTIAFLAAVVRITVPYALAALAGTVSEKAGVVQIALEGLILTGAFAATVGADASHSAAVGVGTGALAGGLLALVFAVVVLYLSLDQIVAGVAINLFADGLTRYLLKVRYDSASNSPRVDAFSSLAREGGLIGALTHPLVLGTVLLTLLIAVALRRTAFGLRLRAVGEHPTAARTLGIDPRLVRIAAVTLGGLLAGLGGAYLAAEQRQFVAGMSAGRGYIALAAMIFGRWRPGAAVLACLLFGAAEALELRLQGGLLPGWAVQMLPYVMTLAVLAGVGGKRRGTGAPAALGRPL
jgi:general nucleoside transport system permease protein